MAPHDKIKPPAETLVGGRIRIREDCVKEAARLFDANGFSPIHVEVLSSGDVMFWFGKETNAAMHRLVACIPREFYAIQAIIGGEIPLLPERARNDR
jgi:hypothetical protein